MDSVVNNSVDNVNNELDPDLQKNPISRPRWLKNEKLILGALLISFGLFLFFFTYCIILFP